MKNIHSRRAILKEHPEVKGGRWKELPVPKVFRDAYPNCGRIERFILNDRMSVQVYLTPTEWGEVMHLVIRPYDGLRLTWYDCQEAKDQSAGPERVAVEVYPARSELHDEGLPVYHLWVLPEGKRLPFGLGPGQAGWGRPR